VHVLRGALRRLQASVGLVSDFLPSTDVRLLDAELRWLTRRLGPLRDLDVFAERLAAGPFHNDAREGDVLLGLNRQARDAALATVRARLRSARATLLIEGLRRYVRDVAPDAIRQFGPDAVRATLSRLDDGIRRIDGPPARMVPKARHRLRKRIKALRYDCEALAPHMPGLADYAARLGALHKVLGDLNDDQACRRLARRLAKDLPVPADVPWLRAEGDSAAELKAAWRRYQAARGPWAKTARRRAAEFAPDQVAPPPDG
jgi:CHAD domain-containing protein